MQLIPGRKPENELPLGAHPMQGLKVVTRETIILNSLSPLGSSGGVITMLSNIASVILQVCTCSLIVEVFQDGGPVCVY